MGSVPEDSPVCMSPAAEDQGAIVPMTPQEPAPRELIGLRLGWISKLEQKTEQVCQVMAWPASPDKERELERRLQEIKEEEESLSALHRDLLASFTQANFSNAQDLEDWEAQEQAQEVAIVRQQFQALQAALEEEQTKTRNLTTQVDSESEEASRVRERLLQVEQASRAIQEKAAAVELQGRQQQGQVAEARAAAEELQRELYQVQEELQRGCDAIKRHELAASELQSRLDAEIAAAGEAQTVLKLQLHDAVCERDMWKAQALAGQEQVARLSAAADEAKKVALNAEDCTKETEREYDDFKISHDALLEHCAHVLSVISAELGCAKEDSSAANGFASELHEALKRAGDQAMDAERFQRQSLQELADVQRRLSEAEEANALADAQLKKSLAHAQALQEEVTLACAHLKDYDQRVQDLEDAKSEVVEADSHKEAALAALHEQLAQMQQEMLQREEELNSASDALRVQLQAAGDEIAGLNAKVSEQMALIKGMTVQQRVAEEEMASMKAEREQRVRDLASLTANLAAYDEESAASESRLEALMNQRASATAQVEELRFEMCVCVCVCVCVCHTLCVCVSRWKSCALKSPEGTRRRKQLSSVAWACNHR